MDKELKDRWLEALRSGRYKQGKDYLHTITNEIGEKIDSYCCLGVLCEVSGLESREYQCDESYIEIANYSKNPHDPATAIPPRDFSETVGLHKKKPYKFTYTDSNLQETEVTNILTDMNDVRCYTFSQIADWIEENL